MLRSKLLILLTMLALALGAFTSAKAQDTPDVFCGDLTEEDCAILQGSNAAMQEVAQYTAAAVYDATLTGIPGLPADSTEVTLSVNGRFAMDDTALPAGQAFAGLTLEEQLQLLSDSPQTMVNFFAGWDFDMTLGVTMTPELAAFLSALSSLDLPDSLRIAVRLVDGVLYWDATELAAIYPSIQAGWVGFPLVDVLTAMAEQGAYDNATLLMDPEVLAEAGAAGTLTTAMGVIKLVQSNPYMFEPFLLVERSEDIELDGQMSATFVTTFDTAAYVDELATRQTIMDLAEAGAFEGTGLTDADIEQAAHMAAVGAPLLFGGITATAIQSIGLDDLYRHSYEAELTWDLAGLMQLIAAGGQLSAELQPTNDDVSLSLFADIAYADLATAQSAAIDAPADALTIPLESLLTGTITP